MTTDPGDHSTMRSSNRSKRTLLAAPPRTLPSNYFEEALPMSAIRYRVLLILRLLTRATIFRTLVTVAILATVAQAQGIPLSNGGLTKVGDTYGGRASDSGATGGVVNSSGGYAVSVPLDLPPTRDGTPIPFGIQYGGNKAGAAGVGWDIPLSYVFVDTTIAHRKPQNTPDQVPASTLPITLSLNGEIIELVRRPFVENDGNWPYYARKDHPLLQAWHTSADKWTVYDGNGHTYIFGLANGTSLWFLDSITGPAGIIAKFTYVPVNTNGYYSIELTNIAYNYNSDGGCAKNEIGLDFDLGYSAPIAATIMGGVVWSRSKVLTNLHIRARKDCDSQLIDLRQYDFSYAPDPDTQLPRLASVDVHGRKGTSEYNSPVPVATYHYGAASVSCGAGCQELMYHEYSVGLPAGPDGNYTGKSSDKQNTEGFPNIYFDTQDLMDFNGDGVPDIVYTPSSGPMKVAIGRMTSTGPSIAAPVVLGDTSVAIDDGISAFAIDVSHTASGPHRQDVWRKVVDVNGDGRLDIIDAAAIAGYWKIYLNTPSSGPSGIAWQVRYVPISTLAQQLKTGGHVLLPARYVPIERTYTDYYEFATGDGSNCNTTNIGLPSNLVSSMEDEMGSFTEWTLEDMNGDGLPDFVYNSFPITYQVSGTYGSNSVCDTMPVGPHGSQNHVNVAYNVAGIALTAVPSGAADVFSAPVTVWQGHCGVGCVVPGLADSGEGFMDVNGDGIPDRVEAVPNLGADGPNSVNAYYGLGSAFSSATMSLPADTTKTAQVFGRGTTAEDVCSNFGLTTAFWGLTVWHGGLRDVTGDGIPDLIVTTGRGGAGLTHPFTEPNPAVQSVYPGTGTGFSTVPLTISGVGYSTASTSYHPGSDAEDFSMSAGLPLSSDEIYCGVPGASTLAGVYDIDGDGLADLVEGNGAGYRVYSLIGSNEATPLGAGRLTAIDNGYGATTQITYTSAKTDQSTPHAVPFPEIVVSSVTTSRVSQTPSDTLVPTLYAYGDAAMAYDPFDERFAFPGYLRSVSLQRTRPALDRRATSQATLDARLPLAASCGSGCSHDYEFDRQMQLGRTSLHSTFMVDEADPWRLLVANPFVDSTDILDYEIMTYASSLTDFGLASEPPLDCIDYQDPYDFDASVGISTYNTCASVGFAYAQDTGTFRGDPSQPGTAVLTDTQVTEDPQYGLPTEVDYYGDVFTSDDNVCVTTAYARFVGSGAPILAAPAARTFDDCGRRRAILKRQNWDYDGLAEGQVAAGNLESASIDRYNLADYDELLSRVTLFTATYDGFGNVSTLTRKREPDGAVQQTTYGYDPFGLAPTHTTTTGGGVSLETSIVRDPLSLKPTSTRDTNGTQRGVSYDGFDRPIETSITPPVASTDPGGVLSVTSYVNFTGATGSTCTGSGSGFARSVATTTFSVPVGSDLSSATGNTITTCLDELGRDLQTEATLGSNYSASIESYKTYDTLGRVAFVSDPFPTTDDAGSAYGTSKFYQDNGDPSCFVRAQGPQASQATTSDPSTETFPTCFYHSFAGNAEYFGTAKPDALTTGSPQYGVISYKAVTAIGRLISRTTAQAAGSGVTNLEYTTFSEDHLGDVTSLNRQKDPTSTSSPLSTLRIYDSLGQVIASSHDQTATEVVTYDSWGEPTEVDWQDATGSATVNYSVATMYDPLGRVVHREDRANGSADPESLMNYVYDDAGPVSPEVTQTYVRGRLSRATSPTGTTVYFSYNAYGAVNARAYVGAGKRYVERRSLLPDGTMTTLKLNLPDDSYATEEIDYSYDSAERPYSITYRGPSSDLTLYQVNPGGVDPLGHLLDANYGAAHYTAEYAPSGRRLLQDAKVGAQVGVHLYSREYTYTGYDSIGRETARQEIRHDTVGVSTSISETYDDLGRLATYNSSANATQWRYAYDSLSNSGIILASDSTGSAQANEVVAAHGVQGNVYGSTPGADRECQVAYGDNAGLLLLEEIFGGTMTSCNVTYDAVGNVLQELAPSGDMQTFTYFPSGAAHTINEGSNSATFHYDPFGNVQELHVTSTTDPREDRNYGDLISIANATSSPVISRKIPGPGGLIARLRGSGGDWIFAFGEARGLRFTTDQNAVPRQDIAYTPFGIATSTLAPTDSSYTKDQWNGGDDLAAFGLVHLGARIYDPVIGRFLSRDPIEGTGTASRTNPYVFAANDPIGASDPSGLCDPSDPCDDDDDWDEWSPAIYDNGVPIAAGTRLFARVGVPWTPPHWSPPPSLPPIPHAPLELPPSWPSRAVHYLPVAGGISDIASGQIRLGLARLGIDVLTLGGDALVDAAAPILGAGVSGDVGLGIVARAGAGGGGTAAGGVAADVAAKAAAETTTEGLVEHGATDLSEQALEYRAQSGLFSGGNVAVLEYQTENGLQTVVAESEQFVGHAERLGAQELAARGVDPSMVTRVYSELQPCTFTFGGGCAAFLENTFPNAVITYSFEYGATSASRAAGVEALQESLMEIFGGE